MKSFRRRSGEGITTPVETRGARMERKDKGVKGETERGQMTREWKVNMSQGDNGEITNKGNKLKTEAG